MRGMMVSVIDDVRVTRTDERDRLETVAGLGDDA